MCEDDRVSIDHPDELAALRAAGRVVADTLRELARRVRPGVSTGELDDVAAGVFARHGARSGPRLDYDFPGAICISVDDECVHGIPGPRRLRVGDLVKLDVTAELDGFYADACRSVFVGTPRPRALRLPTTPARAPARPAARTHSGASAGARTGRGARRRPAERDRRDRAGDGAGRGLRRLRRA